MANEQRLIDANKIEYHEGDCNGGHSYPEDIVTKYQIDRMPTVDAVEVVHGRWEIVEPKRYPDLTARIRCSACKKEPKKHSYEECGHGYRFTVNSWDATDYCPNCGAKMDGGNEDG